MESDDLVRTHRDDLKRVLRDLGARFEETESALDELASEPATSAGVEQLRQIQSGLAGAFKAYLDQNAGFIDQLSTQVRKNEEAKRRAEAMSERTTRPPRDEARLQELSDELTRDLRLQRVDGAIKELLDFLSDAEFFATNASTGRKRKLKTLQTAIEGALLK